MTYSELDSRRFGIRVFRESCTEVHENRVFQEILDHGVDVAILRFPTARQTRFERLNRLGIPYIMTDTLCYYECDLSQWTPKSPKNPGLVFEPATEAHCEVIKGLVSTIFATYTNHYAANPYLPIADMLAGYGEWACGYCRQGEGGRFAWLVKDGNETVAFLTCSQAADMSECEGVLYGVTENATGRGIYGDLIAFSQRFFRDRGISRMKVSTQVQNIAVQRAWVRAGFMPTESFATVHINAFLSHSRRPCDTFPLVVSEADTEHYGRLTGDLNPVHFDDAFAHSIGFEARIAHGIVVDGVASRYFGTIYPGPGCIYLDCSYRFLRPVLLSVPHEVRVTFPFIDVRKGLCKALLRVYDPKGQLCVLSYHDLRMPPESAA